MKFDVSIVADDLNAAGPLAKKIEDMGFDGMWVAETAHNPFLPLAQAAGSSACITLGTAIAVAFPRHPLLMAQTAWDLAANSQGRFILGLGTQIKPHITKRFSAKWGKPISQLREYIEAVHSAWDAMRGGRDMHFAGEYYRFAQRAKQLRTAAAPGLEIPVYIAGVNTGLARLAGELCDGFHVHSFHTVPYLRQVLLPAFQAGRDNSPLAAPLSLSCAVFVVTGRDAEAIAESKIMTKSQIAFYASTPSYRRVLELHGWEELVPRLNALLRRNRWHEMHKLISDDMLEQFAIIAPPADLPYKLRERYAGLLDRAGYYFPFAPEDSGKSDIWQHAARAMIR